MQGHSSGCRGAGDCLTEEVYRSLFFNSLLQSVITFVGSPFCFNFEFGLSLRFGQFVISRCSASPSSRSVVAYVRPRLAEPGYLGCAAASGRTAGAEKRTLLGLAKRVAETRSFSQSPVCFL